MISSDWSDDNLEHRISGKSWDRSWDGTSSNERHNCDHGKTAIIQFSVLLELHCLFANPREVNWWENNSGSSATLHVVGSLSFRSEFRAQDGEQDLALSGIWNGGPRIKGLHGRQRFKGNVGAQHSWEMDAGGLDDVPSGGEHGNTTMLQLRGSEPSKSLITSPFRKIQRVESLDRESVPRHALQVSTESGALALFVASQRV